MSGIDLIIGIALGYVLCHMFCTRFSRTRNYRKDLTNFYVAGKVRQIAAKDSINISDEYEMYKKFLKKRNMEEWDLDVSIEEDLKDKIAEEKKKVGK